MPIASLYSAHDAQNEHVCTMQIVVHLESSIHAPENSLIRRYIIVMCANQSECFEPKIKGVARPSRFGGRSNIKRIPGFGVWAILSHIATIIIRWIQIQVYTLNTLYLPPKREGRATPKYTCMYAHPRECVGSN